MKDDQPLSNRAKHRLRIAAQFLRKDGCKFDDGNFYKMVLDAIQRLDEQVQGKLRSIVDWVEDYELSEIMHWGERHGHSRARNGKSITGSETTKRLPAQNPNKLEE